MVRVVGQVAGSDRCREVRLRGPPVQLQQRSASNCLPCVDVIKVIAQVVVDENKMDVDSDDDNVP